jgi:hypothetical protein
MDSTLSHSASAGPGVPERNMYIHRCLKDQLSTSAIQLVGVRFDKVNWTTVDGSL